MSAMAELECFRAAFVTADDAIVVDPRTVPQPYNLVIRNPNAKWRKILDC